MRKYITYCLLAAAALLGAACNDNFVEEVWRHDVGLKATINSQGVTNVYLRYAKDGEVTYNLPVIVGGSTENTEDLDVKIAVDPDTLPALNEARWKLRTDLYFQELKEQHYEFLSPVCHIPAGQSTGTFDIKFKFSGLDLVDKWVLPLTIVDDPSYKPNPRKNYRKALLRVLPFNDYSGTYSATSMNVYLSDNTNPMVTDARTMFVVSENQCFFYAGVISEELIDREKYKVVLTFNEDGTLSVNAADPNNEMELEVTSTPTWSSRVRQDDVSSYIDHHYITVNLAYSYKDVTTYKNQNYKIPYRAEGTMTMERKINTLIPDQDQAIMW